MLQLIAAACIVLALPDIPAASNGAAPQTTDVLDRVRTALAAFREVDLTASIRTEFPVTAHNTPGIEISLLQVRRSTSRTLQSYRKEVRRPERAPWRLQQDFMVYENGDVLSVQTRLDESLSQVNERPSDLGLLLHSKRLAEAQKIDRTSVHLASNDAAGALWIVGYTSLSDILEQISTPVITNDSGQTLISGETESGHIRLTVSPKSGWLPKELELVKQPHHQTIGGLVSRVYDDNPVESITWTGTTEGFRNDGAGNILPTSMNVVRTTRFQNNNVETIRTAITWDRITLSPDFSDVDFQTSINIPIGEQVSISGANHLPYEWNGNSIVASVPTELPDYLTTKPLRLTKNNSTAVLISINAILLAVLAAVFFKFKTQRK